MAPAPPIGRGEPLAHLRARLSRRFSEAPNVTPAALGQPQGMRLRLVGTPALHSHGEAIALERKDAALLALLASAGATPRAHAAALLWPEAHADGARNNLRQRLFRLRREAGGDVVIGGAVLRLAEDVVHDLAGLPQRLRADPMAAPGELLGANDYADCPELAAWVDLAREQWRAVRRDALAELAAQLEGERQFAPALAYAQRLVSDEPLLEHAHRRVMRLHYLRGDRLAALLACERARDSLQRGLGVCLGAETEQLARLIDAHTDMPPDRPRAPAARAAAIGIKAPTLVGRQAEWRQLQQARAVGGLLLIDGEPGIGKSRLLAEFLGAQPLVCTKPGEAGVPWALLARLVQALTQRFGVPRHAATARELARLVPNMGATADSTPIDPLALQPAMDNALTQWNTDGLTLVGLDDLRHADVSTIDLLPALAAMNTSIAWVAAVRSSHAAALLARWAGTAKGTAPLRLTLDRLDGPAVRSLVASLDIAHLDAAAWAEPLARDCCGNPMLILETLTAMLNDASILSRGPVPVLTPAAGRMLETRLAQLPEPARRLARVVAVAGAEYSTELAIALLGVPAQDVAHAMQQLVSAQVVREHGLVHSLAREAILRSIPKAISKLMREEVAAYIATHGAAPVRAAAFDGHVGTKPWARRTTP